LLFVILYSLGFVCGSPPGSHNYPEKFGGIFFISNLYKMHARSDVWETPLWHHANWAFLSI